MWFSNGEITEEVKNVGFRIKGGISRSFAKKNWKLSFNAFEKGTHSNTHARAPEHTQS